MRPNYYCKLLNRGFCHHKSAEVSMFWAVGFTGSLHRDVLFTMNSKKTSLLCTVKGGTSVELGQVSSCNILDSYYRRGIMLMGHIKIIIRKMAVPAGGFFFTGYILVYSTLTSKVMTVEFFYKLFFTKIMPILPLEAFTMWKQKKCRNKMLTPVSIEPKSLICLWFQVQHSPIWANLACAT